MESKWKVSPQVEVIIVDNKRWNKIVENQIKFIDIVHRWMMENVYKIKIKLENIWIDLIRGIYAPYRVPNKWFGISIDKESSFAETRAQKLMSKFIGPYKILKVMNNSLNITLELWQEFKDRKINPTFHTSLVWPYIKNNDILFPKRDTKVYYDFGNDEDQEWLIKEILAHKWTNNDLESQVKWMVGDVTWDH